MAHVFLVLGGSIPSLAETGVRSYHEELEDMLTGCTEPSLPFVICHPCQSSQEGHPTAVRCQDAPDHSQGKVTLGTFQPPGVPGYHSTPQVSLKASRK